MIGVQPLEAQLAFRSVTPGGEAYQRLIVNLVVWLVLPVGAAVSW
jgi:hypothetical protein